MATVSTAEALEILAKIAQAVVGVKGTDVHLRAGFPPFLRKDGRLARTAASPLSAAQLEAVLIAAAGRPPPASVDAWEFSFDQPGLARFRGHAFRENDAWALALRVVPLQIPTFQELRLPVVVKQLSEPSPGLTLITGPTGSGKSTTAAAMLKHATTSQVIHLVTIEDPIEYRLGDSGSCVSQREVGRDVTSYRDGLRASLREDPDLLFVGEIRDRECLDVALQAAETGRAVLSTFHTSTAVKTLQRLVGFFGADEQATGRARLADVLKGILCQRLLPRRGGRGRVLCSEALVNNYALKECIRDTARTGGIPAILERSGDQHMHSFDQNLAALVRESLVDLEVAQIYASSPGDLRRSLNLQGVA